VDVGRSSSGAADEVDGEAAAAAVQDAVGAVPSVLVVLAYPDGLAVAAVVVAAAVVAAEDSGLAFAAACVLVQGEMFVDAWVQVVTSRYQVTERAMRDVS